MGTMSGKTCMVTGATSGIGKETALQLARLGAAVIIVSRDAARGAAAEAEITSRVPGGWVEVMTADLSSLVQVRRLAGDVIDRHGRLDVLVNNAGVISPRCQLTVDGLETTFATNHLAPFLLTSLLRELLVHSAPARVVTVSSAAHKQVRAIPWDVLPGGAQSGHGQAYPVSKLLNILFTAELARRLVGTGVTANCLHPGFVRTNLGRDVTGVLAAVLPLILRTRPGPAAGARTPVYLASSPDVAGVTGGYFVNRKPGEPSDLAKDAQAAARLWALSEDLADRVGLAGSLGRLGSFRHSGIVCPGIVALMHPENMILLACMDLIDEAARMLGEDVASVMRRSLAAYTEEGWHLTLDPAIVTATVMGASSPPTLGDYAKYITFDAGQRSFTRVLCELDDDAAA